MTARLVTHMFLALMMLVSVAEVIHALADGPAANAQPGTDLAGDPLPDGALARMGTLRWRHAGPVTFVGFSADGKQLVTAGLDGCHHVWEAATGKPLLSIDRPATAPRKIMRPARVGAPGDAPTSVVRSPDRKILAAAVPDGTIRLLDIATGKEVGRIGKLEDSLAHGINGIAFAPDGKTLATRADDQVIRLWDVASGKEIRQIGDAAKDNQIQASFYGSIGNTLAFSADGKSLAAANTTLSEQRNGAVTIWEVATGKELRRINGTASSLSGRMAFSDVLVVAWGDRSTRVYNPATGKEICQIGQQKPDVIIQSLVFSPDGKFLATRAAGSDPAVQLWDIATGNELRHMGAQPTGPADNVFVTSMGAGSSCQQLDFSPDGKFLAEALPSNTVRMWEVDSGKEVPLAAGHQGAVTQIAISADGRALTTRSDDRSVRRWDARTGREIGQQKLPEGAAAAVLSADGQRLAFGDGKNVVHLWDTADFKELGSIEVAGQGQLFDPNGRGSDLLALGPNGKIAAVRGDDRNIHLLDIAAGKELRRLNIRTTGPLGDIALGGDSMSQMKPSLCFSPDGTCLASVETPMIDPFVGRRLRRQREFLCIWQVATGRLLRIFEWQAGTTAAFALSPDGQTVVTTNGVDSVSVWEIITGKECFQFKFDSAAPARQPARADFDLPQREGVGVPAATIQALAISPDGRSLAAGGDSHGLRLFDLTSGMEFGQLAGHRGATVSLAFAADGRTLFSGSADTTALAWDAARFRPAEAAAPALTPEQVAALWKDLADEPVKAHQAIRTLTAAPKGAAALLRERVQPARGVDAKRLAQLIAELEAGQFPVRQKATEELEKLGDLAEPALMKVLDSQPTLETRQRVERILNNLATAQTPLPDVVRELRAIGVLGRLRTPEARVALQALAGGAPGARLTREAQAALDRLNAGERGLR